MTPTFSPHIDAQAFEEASFVSFATMERLDPGTELIVERRGYRHHGIYVGEDRGQRVARRDVALVRAF